MRRKEGIAIKTSIHQAIDFLQARGFLVRGYGFPESESYSDTEQSIADSYRVLQGDFDTGMIEPLQLLEVAERVRGTH